MGRERVRCMSASVSRSITMLITLAPAATRPVPTSAAVSRALQGEAEEAVTNPTMAVKTTSSVMRGLVSSSQSAAVARLRGRLASASMR